MFNTLLDIRLENKEMVLLTDGTFSLHHIIGRVSEITGPCNLFISSFSVSEEPLRFLFLMKAKGQIKNITFLFDKSVKNNKIALCSFANQFSGGVYITSTHIKLVLLDGDVRATIITSANLTNNERSEYSLISFDDSFFTKSKNNFDFLISNSNKFKLNGS